MSLGARCNQSNLRVDARPRFSTLTRFTLAFSSSLVAPPSRKQPAAMSNNMDIDNDGAQPEQQPRSTSPLAFPSSSAGGHPSSDARPATVDRLRSTGNGGRSNWQSHVAHVWGPLTEYTLTHSSELVTFSFPFLLQRRLGSPWRQPAVQRESAALIRRRTLARQWQRSRASRTRRLAAFLSRLRVWLADPAAQHPRRHSLGGTAHSLKPVVSGAEQA